VPSIHFREPNVSSQPPSLSVPLAFRSFFFFSIIPPPPTSTLFPYTTLFRSLDYATLKSARNDLIMLRLTGNRDGSAAVDYTVNRSEEHTSELQSRGHLVCRLLLEKKKKKHK